VSTRAATISVIIPTLNGGELFRDLLQKLSSQSVSIDELLVIDSSSDDTTCLVAEEFGATVLSIARDEFDHGGTRSKAARLAKGELLLFLTQDAVPADNNLIHNLTEPLLTDTSIAISYGRQLPNSNASLAATALRNFNYPDKSVVRQFSDKEKLGLKTAFVSNSCAAYRKSSLEAVGYFPDSLIFGEDTCTAGKILQKNQKIAYVAEAAVYHSHNYTLAQDFRRSFDIGVLHRTEQWLPETYGRAEGEGIRYIKYELSLIMAQRKRYLLPMFFCRNITKFIGYTLGNKYDVLPRWLVPRLSMNRNWWATL